jgi:hypothetical protein
MRPSSEGAPESTLEMEPGSTHLPLLWSVVDFCLFLGFRFASPQAEILLTLRVSIRLIFAPFGLVPFLGPVPYLVPYLELVWHSGLSPSCCPVLARFCWNWGLSPCWGLCSLAGTVIGS